MIRRKFSRFLICLSVCSFLILGQRMFQVVPNVFIYTRVLPLLCVGVLGRFHIFLGRFASQLGLITRWGKRNLIHLRNILGVCPRRDPMFQIRYNLPGLLQVRLARALVSLGITTTTRLHCFFITLLIKRDMRILFTL